jgi:N-acyl-D-amino-acid deacylase
MPPDRDTEGFDYVAAMQNLNSMTRNRTIQVLRWMRFGAALLCGGCCSDVAAYDLVIRNGLLLDGTGSPAISADVAISDGRFVQVGQVEAKGEREIDASGLYLSPGWIDMMDQSGETLLENGLAENKLLMGVTSAFGGEGGTPVPADQVHEYFNTLERQGISLNFGSYFNAFQAREAVVGSNDVEVTALDIVAMQAHMRRAMEAGVVGMSSAAFYAPASFMGTQEMVELARAIAPYGGIYAAHMRDESRNLLPAIEEMITVGEQAGVRVEIFHFKNASAAHWGENTVRAVRRIESAREQGVDIAANQYPYIAGGSGIDATVPTWVFADGPEKAYIRLRDPEIRAGLKREIADPNSDRMVANSGGWNNIVLLSAFNADYQRYQGMSFEDIGKALQQDPADAAWDILLAALPRRANALYFLMSEQDVQFILQQPWVSIGSDAGTSRVLGQAGESALPHPRTYGTFPRIIARYVRELGVLKLEDAIRKMTSYPANRMRMTERGVIREGNWADVVIFDYDTIQDNASWEQPLKTPTGIEYVVVNGEIVVERGKHNGKRPGQVLYGAGFRAKGD